MQRIRFEQSQPLHDVAHTHNLERSLIQALPPHTLMQRAGHASARLSLALAPHADTFWVACGPGNNGGDGLLAAVWLKQWGKTPVVTLLADPKALPADARAAYDQAQAAGVRFAEAPPQAEVGIDALLGLGNTRPIDDRMAQWVEHMNAMNGPVLALDLPSGLHADTGRATGPCVRADHTLSLLTLKPGLFTAQGRDMAGQVWLDTLADPPSAQTSGSGDTEPTALLLGAPAPRHRAHDSHKGSYGNVAVIGGAAGMTGAALLAARAALHQGAGRVWVGLLDTQGLAVDVTCPDLMFRPVESLEVEDCTVVCGCGGGDAVASALPRLLSRANRLVLDADALNAIARDAQLRHLLTARQHRARHTVLTPHPLEAARLLNLTVAQVQDDRLRAARTLADALGCTVVLKGSGTVVASPGQCPAINPTGNARLATAGTGDVLAGMVGAALAHGQDAHAAACSAVWWHGRLADTWPADQVLVASALACAGLAD